MKILKKHKIYKVWNEWAAESVFCQEQPNKQDIKNICIDQGWFGLNENPNDPDCQNLIHQYIHVEKVKHLYSK